MKKIIFICCLLSLAFSIKAQTWYFGQAAGIKFTNSGSWSVSPALSSPLLTTLASSVNNYTNEGCSVTNDANGDVLLYTDGTHIWDATGSQVNDVSGSPVALSGNSSATQSGLIIPVPNPTPQNKCFQKYFVFGVPDIGTYSSNNTYKCNPNNGISYTIVTYSAGTWTASAVQTISQDANGDNIAAVTEKITAIGDVNIGYWILFHGFYNFSSINAASSCLVPTTQTDVIGRKFFAIHILPNNTGTVPAPIVSSIEPMISRQREHNNYLGNGAQGQLKFSKDGTKVAMVTAFAHQIYVYKFNSSTGQVGSLICSKDHFISNIDFTLAPEYGVEFSPNGQYLYISYQYNTLAPTGKITRIDLNDVTYPEVDFAASISTTVRYGELQRGPDNNIYVGHANTSSIIQISNTDALLPTFTNIPITGTCVFGLPTLVQNEMICGEPDSVITDTIPKPCCDIKDLNVSLTETNGTTSLTINGGSAAIQEVTVSMMDYHAVYSNPACKPASIGMPGVLSTTTTTLGTLAFDIASNNTDILLWKLGTPGVINNQPINISVTQPLVLQLPCCEVKFYYCFKVRVKDINCNVCEKIVCSPSKPSDSCGCGKKWTPNSEIRYWDANVGYIKKIDCFARTVLSVASGSNIGYSASQYICDKKNCTLKYDWKIIDRNTNTTVNSGTTTSLPFNFPVPSTIGNYKFVIYPNCGGKVCDSCGFFFDTKTKPGCCGNWKSDSITAVKVIPGQPSQTMTLHCGAVYDNVECISNVNFTFPDYACNPSPTCSPTYTWTITGPIPRTGVTNHINAVDFSTSGSYVLTMYAYCGGKPCDSCKIYINTKPCTVCPKFRANIFSIQCHDILVANNYDFKIFVDNNETSSIGSISLTSATLGMTINSYSPTTVNPLSSIMVSGNASGSGSTTLCIKVTFTVSTLTNGTRSCDTTICFTLPICGNPGKCACNGNWKTNIVTYTGVGMTGSVGCKTGIHLSAGPAYTFTAPAYACNPSNKSCLPIYTWSVNGVLQGTGLTFTHNFTAVNNLVTIRVSCGGKVCDSCIFEVNTTAGTCCPGTWGQKYFYISPAIPNVTIACNTEYKVKCNTPYYLSATFSCNSNSPSCQGRVAYSVSPSVGASIVGNVFTATVSGSYIITMYGICGKDTCDKCEFRFKAECNDCCPVKCDKSLNQIFDNVAAFTSTLTSSRLIDFATNFDLTPITNPSIQTPWGSTWQWDDITFSNIKSYYNTFIETLPGQNININFPPCKYKKAGFDLSLFNNAPAGNYTIKVYSCDCVYTYMLPGNGGYYFGISLPSAIDKIEVSHSTYNAVVDNFRFGN